MSGRILEKEKKSSLVKYIFQTLIMVVPLSTLAGVLLSIFIIKLSGFRLTASILCFFTAGTLLGIFVTFRNYGKFIEPLNEISNMAMNLKNSDITYLIDEKKAGSQTKLIRSLNESVTNLRNTIKETKNVGEQVSMAPVEMKNSIKTLKIISEQVSNATSELAKGAAEQSESIEEVSNSISSIVSGLSKISSDMNETESLAGNALNTVSTGEKSVNFQENKMNETKVFVSKVSGAISALAEKSKEIGDILVVINGIAGQTNMLSLNAAIEAARAGEQGKGFAVVAGEVRKLAEQSELSVQKIEGLIKEVQTDINNVVEEMNNVEVVVQDQEEAMSETIKSFNGIYEAVSAITDNVRAVNAESANLAASAGQSETAIGKVVNILNESASSTEQVAASTEEQTGAVQKILEATEVLSQLAEKLEGNFSNFTV